MPDLQSWVLRLLRDPRARRLLEDPRVKRALVEGLRLRGRASERVDRTLERMAKRLNLATARDVRELKRTIRRLEEELRPNEPDD